MKILSHYPGPIGMEECDIYQIISDNEKLPEVFQSRDEKILEINFPEQFETKIVHLINPIRLV